MSEDKELNEKIRKAIHETRCSDRNCIFAELNADELRERTELREKNAELTKLYEAADEFRISYKNQAEALSLQIRKLQTEVWMYKAVFHGWLRKYWEIQSLSTAVVEASIKEISERKDAEIQQEVSKII